MNQSTAPEISGSAGESLLRQDEVARILKLSPRTLEAWRHRGGGPRYLKLTARITRYRLSDILAWLREGERRHTSDPGPLEQRAEGL